MSVSPPSRLNFPAGAVIVAFLAIVLSVLAGVQSYSGALAMGRQMQDPWKVDLAHRRFEPLRGKLPPNATLGYISDMSTSTDWGLANFFTTQYVLAPRVLVEPQTSRNFEYAIGNFSKQLDYTSYGMMQGLVVVEDLGFGIVLYRKGAR
jgi:hypothetical protein